MWAKEAGGTGTPHSARHLADARRGLDLDVFPRGTWWEAEILADDASLAADDFARNRADRRSRLCGRRADSGQPAKHATAATGLEDRRSLPVEQRFRVPLVPKSVSWIRKIQNISHRSYP